MTTTQGGLRIDAADCPPQLRNQLNYLLDRLQGQQGMVYNLEPTKKPFVTVTAAYTALGTDYVIRADATAGVLTGTGATALKRVSGIATYATGGATAASKACYLNYPAIGITGTVV